MPLGIVTGFSIAKNKDGDTDRLLLQVQLLESVDGSEDDVRIVEMIVQAGNDTNPANGSRVFVVDAADGYKIAIATTDDLIPEVDPGEKEIYSTDNPATLKKARIKLDASGNIINNQGAKSAVTFADLNTALQLMLTALNADIVVAGGAGTSTLDISAAESNTVKLP